MTDDPIATERDRARDGELDSSEESIAGAGAGSVPAPAQVTQPVADDVNHDAGDSSMGGSPESHGRPTFRSSQLDGLEEEKRERARG